MKRLYVTTYRLGEGRDDSDLRKLTARFPEAGAGAGIIAHYRRLDGEGGFVVHELAEDAEQEFGATSGYGDEAAGSCRGTQMPPKAGSGDSRPNGAPAYYLGRPASLWISITGPRRRRNAPNHRADAITGGRERTLSQYSGLFADAGSETVCVTPVSTSLPGH
jgi:hypothetical protein